MKSENIIKKLEKEEYKIVYKTWGYWDGIPHVESDGFDFAIAEYTSQNNWLSCNLDFIYNHVRHALDIAQCNNPILLKKIKESLTEDYYYSRFLILSMKDYYRYMKNEYFYDEYYTVLKKLKKEFNK